MYAFIFVHSFYWLCSFSLLSYRFPPLSLPCHLKLFFSNLTPLLPPSLTSFLPPLSNPRISSHFHSFPITLPLSSTHTCKTFSVCLSLSPHTTLHLSFYIRFSFTANTLAVASHIHLTKLRYNNIQCRCFHLRACEAFCTICSSWRSRNVDNTWVNGCTSVTIYNFWLDSAVPKGSRHMMLSLWYSIVVPSSWCKWLLFSSSSPFPFLLTSYSFLNLLPSFRPSPFFLSRLSLPLLSTSFISSPLHHLSIPAVPTSLSPLSLPHPIFSPLPFLPSGPGKLILYSPSQFSFPA